MKAKETKLLDFLKASPQFVIPIYQRPYRWERAQCQKLWQDILRAGRDPQDVAHFVGSVVYIQDNLYNVTAQPALLVIDGQQRLTTFLLIIEALARLQPKVATNTDSRAAPRRITAQSTCICSPGRVSKRTTGSGSAAGRSPARCSLRML